MGSSMASPAVVHDSQLQTFDFGKKRRTEKLGLLNDRDHKNEFQNARRKKSQSLRTFSKLLKTCVSDAMHWEVVLRSGPE
jgi:hypothetical protein